MARLDSYRNEQHETIESSVDPEVGNAGILEAFLGLMPDAAVVVDAAGQIATANEQAEQLFGYGSGGLRGLAIETLVPERLRHRHRGHRNAFGAAPVKRSMGANFSLTGRRLDGHEFPVDVSLAPIDVSGSSYVIAAVRDLSEQYAAFAAQIELATVVRSSIDAIISTTVEGHVSSWNPAAERLLHFDHEEIAGRHITSLVPDDETETLEALLDSAFQGTRLTARDTRWRTREGGLVDVAVSISPIRFQSETLTGFSFIVRDISERKRTEQELRRLVTEEEQFHRQHAATAEIRLKLLSNAPLDESLMLICEKASELVDSPIAVICRSSLGMVEVVAGTGAAGTLIGQRLSPTESLAGQVIAEGMMIEVPRRSVVSHVSASDALPDGPTLGVPVIVNGGVMGSLTFVRVPGSSGFTTTELDFADTLAAQVAIAFEFERARRDRERMVLVDDRERIARDLHDIVIQRIFATGLTIQTVLAKVDEASTRERLNNAVDQMDETIREIRNTIFALNLPKMTIDELRERVQRIVLDATESLGFTPTSHFEGTGDTAIPEDVAAHVLAVVREALSNASRHAHATTVDVRLEVTTETLSLTVTDNGVGINVTIKSSGLSNLRSRAELCGGRFEVSRPPAGGTCLEWRIPLTMAG